MEYGVDWGRLKDTLPMKTHIPNTRVMNDRWGLLGWVFMMALLSLPLSFWPAAAAAHELPGSTATVVVRDGLVTIDANLDVETWMRAQPSGKLEVMVAAAKKEASAISVLVDGQKMEMELLAFPTVEQVHAVLQQKSDGHSHPKLVQVRWQAKRTAPRLVSVAVAFPTDIGPVLVTYLEPRSQLVQPGGTALFERWSPMVFGPQVQ